MRYLPAVRWRVSTPLSIESAGRERVLVLYVALSVSALMLIKVLLYPDCFAFDANDDANHTFVNLKAARDILRAGEVPNVNLYNNFGTPLMGDALTLPFAIQSVPYWFLPGHLAMTFNRAAIAFLTIVVLYGFLRRRLSPVAALLCTLLVFFSPGVFWNVAHHHYQMALLCFAALLTVQARHPELSRGWFLALLTVGYAVFILSVSIQPVVLALPFLLLFLPVSEGRGAIRAAVLNVVALAAAVIATWPQTAAFIGNMADSTRTAFSPYSGYLTTPREQLLSLFVPAGEWMHYHINGHFGIVTYHSLAYLAFVVAGVVAMLGRRPRDPALWPFVVLGVIPAVAGYLLQFYGDTLPLVRSVDSTRLWWFSNVFLSLAVGRLLDAQWEETFHGARRIVLGAIAILVGSLVLPLDRLFPEIAGAGSLHRLAGWGVLAVLVVMVWRGRWSVTTAKLAVAALCIAALVPTVMQVMALNMRSCELGNHFFARAREASFKPIDLLGKMEPGSRLAAEEVPSQGRELRAIFGGVFGSSARAIVSSQTLMDVLLRERLVVQSDNYFFAPPWQTDKLSRLGIRYVATPYDSRELLDAGWNFTASTDGIRLYENPARPGVIQVLSAGAAPTNASFEVIPNGVRVALPSLQQPGRLVATFFPNPRWRVTVDGVEVQPLMNDLGMMEVPVAPGARAATFEFTGVRWAHFLLAGALAFAVLAVAWRSSRETTARDDK